MRVLAFDTSMGACSAALTVDGALVAHEFALQARGQAETLVPMIERILTAGGLRVRDLDRVGVTLGPGTFTGVRVAVATARALVLGTSVRTGGISSLHAIARAVATGHGAASPGHAIAVVCDARRGEVYVQLFDGAAAPLAAPTVLPPERLPEHIEAHLASGGRSVSLAGTGVDLVADWRTALPFAVDRPDVSPQPDARHIAPLVAALPEADLGPLLPLYLRAPDAKLPARRSNAGAPGQSGRKKISEAP